MKAPHLISVILVILMIHSISAAQEGKHLFILSGQSNMARLNPEESFTPTVEAEFGADHVIVVKDAHGGQPIRRWYKDWESAPGTILTATADLYDSLMNKVYVAIEKERLASVTFVWMQGERDANDGQGAVYETSLIGLYHQLSHDLNRDDVNFVIGRISDNDLANERYPHWTMVRSIQEKVGDSDPRFIWINTDDLNDGVNRQGKEISNDLHMSADGYVVMGKRFAKAAIDLIHHNIS